MIVCYISTKSNLPQLKDIEDDLEVFHKLIETDTIDIVAHTIEGVPFEFVCDDNGLLRRNPKVTALSTDGDGDGEPILVGNLIICKYAGDGELGSLQVKDVEILQRHYCRFEGSDGSQWAGIYGIEMPPTE